MSKPTICPYHPESQLKRYGRADWRCPVDGRNMMFELVLMEDALHRHDIEHSDVDIAPTNVTDEALDEVIRKHDENRFAHGEVNNRKFTVAAIQALYADTHIEQLNSLLNNITPEMISGHTYWRCSIVYKAMNAIQALYAGDIQEPSSNDPSPSECLAELHDGMSVISANQKEVDPEIAQLINDNLFDLLDGEPVNKDKGGDDAKT